MQDAVQKVIELSRKAWKDEAMGMFLDDDEIADLTQKVQRRSQRTVLNALGIIHKVRPDGTLVVAREHAMQVLGVKEIRHKAKEKEPNWGALANA